MQEFISKNEEFQTNLTTLEDFVLFNKDEAKSNYRKYRNIVYGAIINRGYALWETFVKDQFFIYFSLKKEEYYKSETLIGRYRLHELPSYLFEAAVFNLESEQISFNLDKSVLAYTSKNMDMTELSKLFKRIDIDISNKLENDPFLKENSKSIEMPLEEDNSKDVGRTRLALKRIIQERNLVSHSAHIDTFQSPDTLLEWIKFYKLLGKTLSKLLYIEYIETLSTDRKKIGVCKNVVKENVLLVDTASGISIDKKTKIFVYSNKKLIDVVIPQSLKTQDTDVSLITENSKAGIKLETIFQLTTRIKKEYDYCLISEL